MRRLTIGIALLVLLGMVFGGGTVRVPTIAAQEPTERPENYGEVSSVQSFPAFPAGILFWIRVEAPAEETASVEVTLRQNDETVVSGPVAEPLTESAVFRLGPATVYPFYVAFDENPQIQPFVDMLYRIEVETLDGTQTFFEGVTPVEHQNVGTWQTARLEERFTLHWNNQSLGGREIVRDTDEVFRALEQYITPLAPVEIALYIPPQPVCTTVTDDEGNTEQVVSVASETFPCSEAALVELYASSGIEYVTMSAAIYGDVLDRLTENIVLAQYRPRWESVTVPDWFQVGLARYFVPGITAEPLQRVQRAAQLGSLLRYDELGIVPEPDTTDTDLRALWEAHAQLLVKYIADVQGAAAPMAIADLLMDGAAFEDAFVSVMDTDVQSFYAAWRIWLDSASAQSAAVWNLYVPTTPTPTLTATPSEVPLTRTPVPTATITPTWTQRPLFVPTNPPTRTRAAPTVRPTNTFTPLPPGSLDAEPAQSPATENDDDSGNDLCGAGLGVLIFPMMAGIVFWRRQYRG